MSPLDPRKWSSRSSRTGAATGGSGRALDAETVNQRIAAARHNLDKQRRRVGGDSPITAQAELALSHELEAAGRIDEVIALRGHVFTMFTAYLGESDPATTEVEWELAEALYRAERWGEVRTRLEHVLDVEGAEEPDSLGALRALGLLAQTLVQLEDYERACELFAQVVEGFRTAFGPADERTLMYSRWWAQVLSKTDQLDQAVEVSREIVDASSMELATDDPLRQEDLFRLAVYLRLSGHDAEAKVITLSVLRVLAEQQPPGTENDLLQRAASLLMSIEGDARGPNPRRRRRTL